MIDERPDPGTDTTVGDAAQPATPRVRRTRARTATADPGTAAPDAPAADPATPAAPARARRRAATAAAPAPEVDGAEGVETTEAPKRARRAGLPVRDEPAPGRVDGDEGARQALELGRRVVDLAEDKKASDIVLIHVGELTTLADYLVICSGGSERQLGAIADGIAQGLKEEGITAIGREGEPSAHWVLMDFGSVIVHVFAEPEREFYQLEKLWADAPMLLRVQ